MCWRTARTKKQDRELIEEEEEEERTLMDELLIFFIFLFIKFKHLSTLGT